MRKAAWGAVIAILLLAGAFWVGRLTVPDRTQEVKDWRDSAQAVLDASLLREAERAAADSARIAGAEALAEAAGQRILVTLERDAARGRVIDSLRAEVAQAEDLRDTARIVLAQAAVIVTQDSTIQDLRVGMMDAQATMVELRGDLQAVRAARAEDAGEIGRLRETIAAGLAATQPSRGKSRPFRCVTGVGVTTGGSGLGGMCGLAVL